MNSVTRSPRERVTIDLRGIGPTVHTHAAARGKTTAAVVRAAVVAMLDADGGSMEPACAAESIDVRAVKVTLRLDGVHAACLAKRARSADVSQGAYVMGLLDGLPPSPRSADHGVAVAALADSTHKVAAMSADIHGFLRLIRNAKGDEAAEKYRAGLMSLAVNMRVHLEVASRLMTELTSQPRMRLGPGARRRDGVSR